MSTHFVVSIFLIANGYMLGGYGCLLLAKAENTEGCCSILAKFLNQRA